MEGAGFQSLVGSQLAEFVDTYHQSCLLCEEDVDAVENVGPGNLRGFVQKCLIPTWNIDGREDLAAEDEIESSSFCSVCVEKVSKLLTLYRKVVELQREFNLERSVLLKDVLKNFLKCAIGKGRNRNEIIQYWNEEVGLELECAEPQEIVEDFLTDRESQLLFVCQEESEEVNSIQGIVEEIELVEDFYPDGEFQEMTQEVVSMSEIVEENYVDFQAARETEKVDSIAKILEMEGDEMFQADEDDSKEKKVKLVIDNEKPSTSKKLVAEIKKNSRKNKTTTKVLNESEDEAKRSVLDSSENDNDENNKGSMKKESEPATKKIVPEIGKNTRKSKIINKIARSEAEAKRSVLDSSDEDGEGSSSMEKEREQRKSRVKKKREKSSIPADLRSDGKLQPDAAYVKLLKLSEKIEIELKKKHFVLVTDEENSTGNESDTSIVKLNREINALSRYNSNLDKNGEGKTPSSKDSHKQQRSKNSKTKSSKIKSFEEGALTGGSDSEAADNRRGMIKIKSLRQIIDIDLLSDQSDVDDTVVEDKDKKLEQSEKSNKDSKKNSEKKKKRYQTPNLKFDDSDESTSDKRDVLDDSDDDDFKTTPKKSKAKTVVSDSGSEVAAPLRRRNNQKKKKKRLLDSDSENGSGEEFNASVKSEENSDDSDFAMKKKKRRLPGSSSSSDGETEKKKNKPKPKRKRIKVARDSDDNSADSSKAKSDDSDIQEIPGSQRRKDIRKIMSNKELNKSTKEAEKEEEERKKRVLEKQKLFNGVFDREEIVEKGKVKRLVLEIDPNTKEPLIEVDESIVSKLKPHQAGGIKFMYTTCFESLEMIEKGKEGGCILAHCMGLGKTLQTVAFTHTVLEKAKLTKIKRVLVVCPLNTVNNWYKEYQKWLSDISTEKQPPLHALWEGKNISERIGALKWWEKKGGVAIIHYECFRTLVNFVIGTKGKAAIKAKQSQKDVIKEVLLDPGPDMVVCDEGHLLKNYKSKLSEALNQVKTMRRVVLTGTPLQNNLIEYHTMVNFVKPNLLGNLVEFKNRFVNPIHNGQCKDSSERDVKIMKRRAHVLHSKLDGCVQRLDHSELTDYLPPKYEYCIIIKLSDKQKELYRHYLATQCPTERVEQGRQILMHYAALIKIIAHPIVLTMRKEKETEDDGSEGSIKDFICDNSEDDRSTTPEPDIESEIECLNEDLGKPERVTRSMRGNQPLTSLTEQHKTFDAPLPRGWWTPLFNPDEDMHDVSLSGKLIVLQEILKICETIGDKVLVFSQYLTTLDIVERFLGEWDAKAAEENKKNKQQTFPLTSSASEGRWRKGIEYFRIDGQTKTNDRQKDCDTFNKKSAASKAKLFLISTKAGGLGINLFGANRVVIFDASWNPSNDMQSIFRVYRFGQIKPCYIYRFVSQATMEEKIYNRQVVKLSLSSRVIDEHQIERHFKYGDINEMFQFNPDERTERPTPPLPKDRLLADLLISQKNWIDSYFEHDSLLINKREEELTEEERKQAWEEYQSDNGRRAQPQQLSTLEDQITLHKIKIRLGERFPHAPLDDIDRSTILVFQKIQELRMLLERQHLAPIQSNHQKIAKLRQWIAQSLNTSEVETNFLSPQPPLPRPPPQQYANNTELFQGLQRQFMNSISAAAARNNGVSNQRLGVTGAGAFQPNFMNFIPQPHQANGVGPTNFVRVNQMNGIGTSENPIDMDFD